MLGIVRVTTTVRGTSDVLIVNRQAVRQPGPQKSPTPLGIEPGINRRRIRNGD